MPPIAERGGVDAIVNRPALSDDEEFLRVIRSSRKKIYNQRK